ncbi:hypothetical protein BJ742DRAFT_823091 [Cladochytrium replicatum]|nr:hypothetical protein BJ742DRAFT_823091 [Cladochytrium replicatum]
MEEEDRTPREDPQPQPEHGETEKPREMSPALSFSPSLSKDALRVYLAREHIYAKALDKQQVRQEADQKAMWERLSTSTRDGIFFDISADQRMGGVRSVGKIGGDVVPIRDKAGNLLIHETVRDRNGNFVWNGREATVKRRDYYHTITERSLNDVAEIPETLVPIRLDIEFENVKLRDTFTWNMNDEHINPTAFAEQLCDDLQISPALTPLFVQAITLSIREQVEDYKNNSPLAVHLPPFFGSRGNDGVDENVQDGPDLRVAIKLDITIGNFYLLDAFEWDLNCKRNNPESFAEKMADELGLPSEFRSAIAHSIREQLHIYAKSLLIIDHNFESSVIDDEELAASFLPEIPAKLPKSILRDPSSAQLYAPSFQELESEEVDRLEKERDKDRDLKRKKRQTQRSRRMLPDREPPKTVLSLLPHQFVETIVGGDISGANSHSAYEHGTSSVNTSPMNLRRGIQGWASSAGYQPSTPSGSASGVVSGPGRPRKLRNLDALNNTSNSTASAPAPPPTHITYMMGESPVRKRQRVAAWRCENCSCSAKETSLIRKGPNGSQSLCNRCGIYYSKTNTPRPLSPRSRQRILDIAAAEEARTIAAAAAAAATPPPPIPDPVHALMDQIEQSPFIAATSHPPSHIQTQQQPSQTQHSSGNSTPPDSAGSLGDNRPPRVRPDTSSLPSWLVDAKLALEEKYPDDRFEVILRGVEYRLKCHDCPGKVYNPGDGQTLGNFEIHLRNKAHRAKVAQRMGGHAEGDPMFAGDHNFSY